VPHLVHTTPQIYLAGHCLYSHVVFFVHLPHCLFVTLHLHWHILHTLFIYCCYFIVDLVLLFIIIVIVYFPFYFYPTPCLVGFCCICPTWHCSCLSLTFFPFIPLRQITHVVILLFVTCIVPLVTLLPFTYALYTFVIYCLECSLFSLILFLFPFVKFPIIYSPCLHTRLFHHLPLVYLHIPVTLCLTQHTLPCIVFAITLFLVGVVVVPYVPVTYIVLSYLLFCLCAYLLFYFVTLYYYCCVLLLYYLLC